MEEDESKISGDVRTLITRLYYECMSLKRNLSTNETLDTSSHCPTTFDGYLCWPRTEAGQTVSQRCPSFVTGFDSKLMAHKKCHDNGTWFVHPETGLEWSNYTTCVDVQDLEFRHVVNNLYLKGYAVSLVALLLSLFVFLTFRSLRCTRIRIHVQLFTSLALSCVAWIVWYKFIIDQPQNISDNSVWCIALHIVLHYLMLANYFWMFCEGLHLHLVLVVVFVKDTVALRWFYVIGWVTPIFLVFIYGLVRSYLTTDFDHCWTSESNSMWILTIPVCLSLAASMVFLINVVCVLVKKLHPCSAQPAPLAIRKAARATVILVPLFGLQHILLPFRPDTGSPFESYYQIVSAVLVSLQGFCVSCLFCFANHDVLFAARSLMVRLFPNMVKPNQPSNNAPPVTQSRDMNV